MKYCTLISLLLLVAGTYGQTPIDLSDNLQIQSGDNLLLNTNIYSFSDAAQNGVILIKDVQNVTIDGNQSELHGAAFQGYAIKIENATNITLKNFKMIKGYFYAIHAINSSGIVIENSTISENKRDDAGWIVIFQGAADAHGGAVFMDSCQTSTISDNTMTGQNDGVAIYNCSNIDILNNDLSWNTSYGIRMFHSHYCNILDNNASHINRPLTDPSDCAAILLLDAFNNKVERNDFSHSGDGIFLNNYYSMEPANNYFAYNDCSYSPHNAIEAVFSDGNIFNHNTCNHSNYGFWLGYSFNSIIDSNEIRFNAGLDADGGGGIAIDRGYNNVISHNIIANNSQGVRLWDGSPIAPYNSNDSKDYMLSLNTFYGNRIALNATSTENLSVTNNDFDKNFTDISLSGATAGTMINNCNFGNTIGYFIENKGPLDINAQGNWFPDFSALDPGLLDCKIYDESDHPPLGKVDISNYSLVNYDLTANASGDLTEPDSAVWDAYYYVEDAAETNISWDYNDRQSGAASLFCDTESGFDVHLHYFPAGDKLAFWNLDPTGSLKFAIKINITDPGNLWGVQESFVRLGDACGNYIQFNNEYGTTNPNPVLNQALNTWKNFEIPLDGNSTWILSSNGVLDLNQPISYIEFNVDVWEYGYEMWLDDVQLPVATSATRETEALAFQLSPNPAQEYLAVQSTRDLGLKTWEITDALGKVLGSGSFPIDGKINVSGLDNGVYILMLKGSMGYGARKFVVLK